MRHSGTFPAVPWLSLDAVNLLAAGDFSRGLLECYASVKMAVYGLFRPQLVTHDV
jgi:hypothetical protein